MDIRGILLTDTDVTMLSPSDTRRMMILFQLEAAPSGNEQLERLVVESAGRFVELTGPSFPTMSAEDKALKLMQVAEKMPRHLMVPTLNFAMTIMLIDEIDQIDESHA
jgi:hypothetical protein